MNAPDKGDEVGATASHGWAIWEAVHLTPLAQSILRERRAEADREEARLIGRFWRDRTLRAATEDRDH